MLVSFEAKVCSDHLNFLSRLPNRLTSNSHASGFGFQLADLRRFKQHNHHQDVEMTDRGSLCNQVLNRLHSTTHRRAASSGALELDTN